MIGVRLELVYGSYLSLYGVNIKHTSAFILSQFTSAPCDISLYTDIRRPITPYTYYFQQRYSNPCDQVQSYKITAEFTCCVLDHLSVNSYK